MSDSFGISNAMKGMALAYFQSSRASGRTTQMVESLKDGDRVVFCNHREAERVSGMCKERGIDVKCITISPKDPHRLFEQGTPEGRTVFDHSWVEEMFLNSIKDCEKQIDHFQTQLSGFGEAHLETRRKAFEMSKWRV